MFTSSSSSSCPCSREFNRVFRTCSPVSRPAPGGALYVRSCNPRSRAPADVVQVVDVRRPVDHTVNAPHAIDATSRTRVGTIGTPVMSHSSESRVASSA